VRNILNIGSVSGVSGVEHPAQVHCIGGAQASTATAPRLVTGATHQRHRMVAHAISNYMHRACFMATASQLELMLTAGTGCVHAGEVRSCEAFEESETQLDQIVR
jgi:hypothetical protein